MKSFNEVVSILTEARIPCRVKETKFHDQVEISIECGFNFPDELVDRIYSAFGGNLPKEISICADSCGGEVTNRARIAGGPKEYWD